MGAWVQTTLFENEAKLVEEEKGHQPAVERCDVKCLNAVHEKCRCRCGGRNHGYLQRIKNSKLDQYIDYLWLNHIPEIRRIFEDARCLNCGHKLLDSEILGYPHNGGIYVEDYDMRLWVFARCSRCQCDNSFVKIERLKMCVSEVQERK